MPTPVTERVRKRREALRAAGLRPVQLWIPDTRTADFGGECRRQARLTAAADIAEPNLEMFLDAAVLDLHQATEE